MKAYVILVENRKQGGCRVSQESYKTEEGARNFIRKRSDYAGEDFKTIFENEIEIGWLGWVYYGKENIYQIYETTVRG